MCNNKSKHFLEKEFDLKNFKKSQNENPVEQEFIMWYKKLNDRINEDVPDFNPFEKVKQHKKQRFLQTKRLFGYAASFLLIVSLLFVGIKHKQKEKHLTMTAQELTEIQENTKLALWHFSKELNTCLGNIEKAKKINTPLSEVQSLKNVDIQFHNPIKDLKIN